MRQTPQRALLVLSVMLLVAAILTGSTAADAQDVTAARGDVDCNDVFDLSDAQRLAEFGVGLRTDGGACPLGNLAGQLNAARADVDRNGVVDAGDTLRIAQCAGNVIGVDCPTRVLALRGVNLAGAEFGDGLTIGEIGVDYEYPDAEGIDFFADAGMNTIRVPFAWERLQRVANGPFDAVEIGELDRVVEYATSRGVSVILDPHNFGAYYGNPIGSPGAPESAFVDFWQRLAERYGDNPRVIFGLMNEPIDITQTVWVSAANAAIATIRDTGATNLVLVPGINFSTASRWNDSSIAGVSNAEAILSIVDPGNNAAVEVHQYLDESQSGTSDTCVSTTIGAERLSDFTDWLASNGVRGFLGEFGVAENTTCLAALDTMLSFIDANDDVWLGWTYWAAGPLWPQDYVYSVEPFQGVADDAQFPVLLDHLD